MPRYGPADSLKSPRFTGPSTFARLPHVEDLDGVDLAITGVPFDTGVSYRVGGRFGPAAVIDFDAHTDAWDSYFGQRYNHGTWLRRAVEEGLVDVEHSLEVGLRGTLY